MPELQRLRAGHAPAVLAFELANRAYFAAFISDRGDDYFDQFAERHRALLAEQDAGTGAFYVLVARDGSVAGRFNLNFTGDGTAELGYRVAEHAAGRGVATATVREVCRLAAARHGLRVLRAAVSRENVASRKVLAKAGFAPAGPAEPAHLGGKTGTWYRRDLAAGPDGPGRGPGDRPAAGYPHGMAYDQELAERIRELIGHPPDLTEKKMFGGLAFLIGGNMAIAASGQGGAMIRVDPGQSDALVAATPATPAVMRGRPMRGWLRLSSDDLRDDDELALWVDRGAGYARSLPPKP